MTDVILVSNPSNIDKITLKSFCGDSVDIGPGAKNVPVEAKFDWNPPRGTIIERPNEKKETEEASPDNNAGSSGQGVDGSTIFEGEAERARQAENEGNPSLNPDKAGNQAREETQAQRVVQGRALGTTITNSPNPGRE